MFTSMENAIQRTAIGEKWEHNNSAAVIYSLCMTRALRRDMCTSRCPNTGGGSFGSTRGPISRIQIGRITQCIIGSFGNRLLIANSIERCLMTSIFYQWRLIASISLIFSSIGCSAQYAQAQTQMMAADHGPISKLEEKGIAAKQMPLPHEPMLFEMAKDLPPSAMLRDQEGPTAPHASPVFRTEEKAGPIAMPSEPKPR
jgi:hypothetical protein